MQNIFELITQLNTLQKKVAPILPKVSQKLVQDLLDSGTGADKIGKAINRSPSFIRQVSGGKKTLTAGQIVEVVRRVTGGAK